MEKTIRIKRFDPEADLPQVYHQEFKVEVEESSSVLDALITIRESIDESLAVRCSCRGAICGSCGLRVNGQATLACKTKINSFRGNNGIITVEPMGNMTVVKDLVTLMRPFWEKIRQVTPWLQPAGDSPKAEYLAPPEMMTHLNGVMGCIMCGVCVSDCAALEVDSTFVGPAALAKAYRFVADPRDAATEKRLRALDESTGMWECTRCMACVEVCPKGVAPMDRIMSLRSKGMNAGLTDTYGARHSMGFIDVIRDKGILDEVMLTVKTLGMFNIPRFISLLPVAIRSLFHGKLPKPGPFHKPIPGIRNIRRIVETTEKMK
tara:strand:+ start:2792 stop:3751 length:960 start_codon:yes stop_codon:yes gene_type:complete